MDPEVVRTIFANTVAIGWHAPDDIDPNSLPEEWIPGVNGPPVKTTGTGFLIAPRVVLTALHVIRGITKCGVEMRNICVCCATPPVAPQLRGNIEVRRGNVFSELGAIGPGGVRIARGTLTPQTDICLIVLEHAVNDDPSEARPPPYRVPHGLRFADPESIRLHPGATDDQCTTFNVTSIWADATVRSPGQHRALPLRGLGRRYRLLDRCNRRSRAQRRTRLQHVGRGHWDRHFRTVP
jgi:hypothetical protein